MDPLLILAIVLTVGACGGWLARLVRLPTVTGNILAGVLIGPVLHLFNVEATVGAFRPITSFAMALITVAIGGHLSYRRIHNALGRISAIVLGEMAATIALVTFAIHTLTGEWLISLMLGVLAAETAPGTIVHVVRECRAKGPFVKTLLSGVAVNNILTIAMFAVVTTLIATRAQSPASTAGGEVNIWLAPSWSLLGAIVLGLTAGWLSEFVARSPQFHNFSTVFVAILCCIGLARYLGLNPLLTTLAFGIWLGNGSHVAEGQLSALAPIERVVYTLFFTLAGFTLHFDALGQLGLIGFAYVGMRLVGKLSGAALGGVLAASSPRIWQNMPLAILPHAGLVLALIVLLQDDARISGTVRQTVSAVVLAAAVINEILGPPLTKWAIRRAKENDKDRPRLIAFLEEEFIKTDLKATDKWDAIRQLCDFLIRTHKVEHVHPDDLFRSVAEREKADSTAIGRGAAIPHGTVADGPAIQGVLGICRDGVDWGAPDGQRVRLIMLIATPANQAQQHLQVLAALTAMVSNEVIRSRLTTAADANAAWEIIESEETPTYNYFLEG